MTNLLPASAKKQIVLEYWVRVLSVWVIVWSLSLLISAVLLWPTYVLIVGSSDAYADSVADASQRTAEYDSISLSLIQASQQAQTVVVADSQADLSAIFTDIKNKAGQQIDLSAISLKRNEEGIGTILVTGEASDRQALAMFRDRLEVLVYVDSVDFPISNLAENQDIQFNLSVAVNSKSL